MKIVFEFVHVPQFFLFSDYNTFDVSSNIAYDANTTEDEIIEVSKLTGSGGAIAVNLRRGHTAGTFSATVDGFFIQSK